MFEGSGEENFEGPFRLWYRLVLRFVYRVEQPTREKRKPNIRKIKS